MKGITNVLIYYGLYKSVMAHHAGVEPAAFASG
ncbi:MAG: hypothetical protein ACI8SZ_001405, partial [Colwellia sp.]